MDASAGLLAGELANHFQHTVILTALVAAFVLWRYRAAILRGMGESVAEVPLPTDVATVARAASGSGKSPAARAATGSAAIAGMPNRPSVGLPDDEALCRASLRAGEQRSRRRLAVAYLVAAGTCSLLLAAVYTWLLRQSLSPTYVFALTCIYLLCVLPMIGASLAWPLWRGLAYGVGLLAAGAAASLVVGIIERAFYGRPPGLAQLGLVRLFVEMAWTQLWLPALLLLLTGSARLRGVAPITFAGLFVFGLAPFAGSRLTQSLAATEAGTPWALRLGLDGLFVLIALPVGWLAWRRLRAVAREHAAKRFSDAQLLARTWWLMLVACLALDVLSIGARPVDVLLGCGGAALAFSTALALALRAVHIERERPPPRRLLLLRVFGFTARTERLFDRVAARWRLLGPVAVIAAPDVAARTIEPGDFLRYLTGRLTETFVRSRADLDARLAAMDGTPDPDGRFRINAFCCAAGSWRASIIELIARADAILFDVRGFGPHHRGCEFELRALAARVPLSKVVLIVDGKTDQPLLAQTLGSGHADVRRAVVERAHERETGAIFQQLVDAACSSAPTCSDSRLATTEGPDLIRGAAPA